MANELVPSEFNSHISFTLSLSTFSTELYIISLCLDILPWNSLAFTALQLSVPLAFAIVKVK